MHRKHKKEIAANGKNREKKTVGKKNTFDYGKRGSFNDNGKSLLVIATPSMSGSIEAGDAIIIEKQDSYEVGDIITYFPVGENTSVTHRLVRIEGDKYYTKGDANPSEDPDPVYFSQIAGKVTGRIRNIGILIEWLRSWQGIAFLVAVAAVVIAIIMVGDKSNGLPSGEENSAGKTAENENEK